VNVKELMEKRAEAVKAARAINDVAAKEGRKFSAEEQARYDAADADVARLTEAIEREQRLARAETTLVEIPGSETPRKPAEQGAKVDGDAALRSWMRAKAGIDISDAERANVRAAGFGLGGEYLDLRIAGKAPRTLREARDLSATNAATGAATIAEGFVRQLEESLLYYGPMRQAASVIRTAEGNALPWPTVDDTANTGAILAENTSFGSSVDPTFGTITFGAYKYSSKPVLVPNELLQDSAFDLASYIASALGQRIGRIQNTHFTTGDNSSKPNGVVTASGQGNTAATSTAITMDELIVTQHALDIAYRQGAAWMLHDTVASYVRRLKDGNGQYLWQPSIVAGRPDMLLGSPVWINNDMASTISGTNKTLIYGDFSKYMIRDAGTVRLVRMNERYADTDQVGFVAFLRSDADLLDAGTNPVVHFKQG